MENKNNNQQMKKHILRFAEQVKSYVINWILTSTSGIVSRPMKSYLVRYCFIKYDLLNCSIIERNVFCIKKRAKST